MGFMSAPLWMGLEEFTAHNARAEDVAQGSDFPP